MIICINGFFGDKTRNICKACNEDCKTCDGPSNLECLSCNIFTVKYIIYLSNIFNKNTII